MRGWILPLSLLISLAGFSTPIEGHDRETTSVTWNQTISRIIYQRCGSCHRPDGSAFSLMTYDDARPWAVAIRDEIFARTMPPWGAVKGFGSFRNEGAISPAQTNLIVSWIEGGVPKGEPSDLEPAPEYPDDTAVAEVPGSIVAKGTFIVKDRFLLDGLWPREIPDEGSFQITAELPSGAIVPLVWLYEYRSAYGHPFLLKSPLELPAGSVIRGIPDNASIALLPVQSDSGSLD